MVKSLALLLPLLIFVWWLLAGTGLTRAAARLAVMVLCSSVVILPWTARNLAQLGTPVLLSTSRGPNLWIGNNPDAPGYFYFPPGNPLKSEDLTEVERDAEGYRLALQFARERPLRVIVLMPKKVYHLFAADVYAANEAARELRRPVPPLLTRSLATVSQYYYLAVLGLALVSLFVLRGWWQHPRVLVVLVFAYWAMVHAVFFGGDRFHFPLAPLLCIAATHALAVFWAGARRGLGAAGEPVEDHNRDADG